MDGTVRKEETRRPKGRFMEAVRERTWQWQKIGANGDGKFTVATPSGRSRKKK